MKPLHRFLLVKYYYDRGGVYIGFLNAIVGAPLALLTLLGVFDVHLTRALWIVALLGALYMGAHMALGYVDVRIGGAKIDNAIRNAENEAIQSLLRRRRRSRPKS